jgi:hypothetical protein
MCENFTRGLSGYIINDFRKETTPKSWSKGRDCGQILLLLAEQILEQEQSDSDNKVEGERK